MNNALLCKPLEDKADYNSESNNMLHFHFFYIFESHAGENAMKYLSKHVSKRHVSHKDLYLSLSFSCPVMRTQVHATGTPSVSARGRGPARGPQEAEKAPENQTSFSTPQAASPWQICRGQVGEGTPTDPTSPTTMRQPNPRIHPS